MPDAKNAGRAKHGLTPLPLVGDFLVVLSGQTSNYTFSRLSRLYDLIMEARQVADETFPPND